MRSECEKSVCYSLCAEHYIFLCFIYVCVYFVMRKSENVCVCAMKMSFTHVTWFMSAQSVIVIASVFRLTDFSDH